MCSRCSFKNNCYNLINLSNATKKIFPIFDSSKFEIRLHIHVFGIPKLHAVMEVYRRDTIKLHPFTKLIIYKLTAVGREFRMKFFLFGVHDIKSFPVTVKHNVNLT